MAADLLNKWLAVWQPLTLGQFGDAGANGLALTCGQFWLRTGGGYNLYRWTGDRTPVAPGAIMGAAGPGASEVRTFPRVAHAASTRYWYLLRAVGAGGVEEGNTDCVAGVGFDAAGQWLGLAPNAPECLRATAQSGGMVVLGWRYNPAGEAIAPSRFAVFGEQTDGAMDWDTPVGEVSYRSGRADYVWRVGPFEHGTRLAWSVRAVSAGGVSDGNEVQAVVWTDGCGPISASGLMVQPGRTGSR